MENEIQFLNEELTEILGELKSLSRLVEKRKIGVEEATDEAERLTEKVQSYSKLLKRIMKSFATDDPTKPTQGKVVRKLTPQEAFEKSKELQQKTQGATKNYDPKTGVTTYQTKEGQKFTDKDISNLDKYVKKNAKPDSAEIDSKLKKSTENYQRISDQTGKTLYREGAVKTNVPGYKAHYDITTKPLEKPEIKRQIGQ